MREPLLLELQGKRTLSVNIFDQEEYLGCLTVFEGTRLFRASDKALAVGGGVLEALLHFHKYG